MRGSPFLHHLAEGILSFSEAHGGRVDGQLVALWPVCGGLFLRFTSYAR